MTAKQQVEVEGRSIALSNLDKVLYAGADFTKAHVIDYYIRVAPWLLPHYVARPVTMKRFPDGVGGKAFYEKMRRSIRRNGCTQRKCLALLAASPSGISASTISRHWSGAQI